jgi:hypothetical protein
MTSSNYLKSLILVFLHSQHKSGTYVQGVRARDLAAAQAEKEGHTLETFAALVQEMIKKYKGVDL